MPRCLTPGRICLVILIELYLSEDIGVEAKTSLIKFIANNIDLPTADEQNYRSQLPGNNISIFTPLSQWPSSMPGRNAHDVFLQRIWELDGLDSLIVLLNRLQGILASPVTSTTPVPYRLSRASPFGQCIRKASVEFTRLTFAETCVLWQAFTTYRAPTFESWAQRNPVSAKHMAENETDNPPQPSSINLEEGTLSVSDDDIDRLITFSIQRLQRQGTRLPAAIKTKLQQWMITQSDLTSLSLKHFLAFFEHWRAGQYSMALESLHRYFDYSLGTRTGNDNMRVYYQYALLHLSALHADFECWEESADAMNECIATARENQDTTCLNYAVSWLLYLRQAGLSSKKASFGSIGSLSGTAGGERDEIAFLKAKAKDMKHWALLSSTLLEEAKLDMHDSGSPAKAMEHIVQSAFLNTQHDLRSMMGASLLFHGAFLGRIGQPHVAMQAYDSICVIHRSTSPVHDVTRALCQKAYGLALNGLYNESLKVLQDLKPSVAGINKLEQRLVGFKALTLLFRDLRCGNPAADYYMEQLQILRNISDAELSFAIDLVELDWMIYTGRLELAWTTVHAHLRQQKHGDAFDISQRLKLLVVKANLFVLGEASTKALSLVLRVASTAMRLDLVTILLEALAVLSKVLNDLHEFEAARALLVAALPQALEGNDQRLVADLYARLADSYVGTAGQCSESEATEQSRYMRTAESYTERSRIVYATIQDTPGLLKTLAMKARLAHWHGDETLAMQAEDLYAQVVADTTLRDGAG